ncbi:MAG: hypothetical protein ACJA1C_002606 [Crocinitomicaceae bacterium]|jgi:hypothetical protein
MRIALTALLFLLSISNSNAYLGVASSDPTFYEMPISYVFTSATLAGPSDYEISLMAKIDSQEVAMNNLYDHSDSIHIILNQQKNALKKAELKAAQYEEQRKKEHQLRLIYQRDLKYLGIALGIASLISVFLTFMWLRSRRK